MTSNKEATLFDAMTTAAPQMSQLQDFEGDTPGWRQEQEENLILAAWKSMSVALQQHSVCEDPTAPGPAQSFLAMQRKSTQARRVPPPPAAAQEGCFLFMEKWRSAAYSLTGCKQD